MGNVHGWGGPVGPTYIKMQQILQQKIIKQQREFGMIVAVPSFSGHLPIAMQKLYPKSNFSIIDRWNKFPKKFCCALFLDPNDSLFQKITNIFVNRVIDAYGTDHVYFADPFNEIQPRIADPSYLNMTAYHIFSSMRAVDSEAIWLMQGWMFVKNIFWSDKLISAFLMAVPVGGLLVLDLQSEQYPQYERTHSYHGHFFIWCMLHNFGGTLGMHGSVNYVNNRIANARSMANSSMVGVGITPEGIHQNYVMYELTLERGWLKENVNLTEWFNKFSDVQYGIEHEKLRKAWQLLRLSVYSYYGLEKIRGKYVVARRPSTRLNVWTWYKFSDLYKSWSNLLLSNASIPDTHYNNYENDLVDITRQALQVISDRIYVNLMEAFKRNETIRYHFLSQEMILLLDDLDAILSTHKNFLLGIWLQNAKSWATCDKEEHQFEFNARNQISLWGPSGQIVDYATKQWSGVVRDFYKPRWQLFLNQLSCCLVNGAPFNNTLFIKTVLAKVEQPFTIQRKRYPTLAHGNSYNVSLYIFKKWYKFLSNKTVLNNMLKVRVKKINNKKFRNYFVPL